MFEQYSLPDALEFRTATNGLVFAEIATPLATASLCLQGGHLMHWQPAHQSEPVLWMSRDAKFEPGKSIRGGVPVCWPWFGPHASEPTFPAHGFARASAWEVIDSALENGAVRLDLRLSAGQGAAYWPHTSSLHLSVRIGTTLSMSLTTQNLDAQPLILGEALHTYFKISDIAYIAVNGLEGEEYWDTVGGVNKCRQQGAIQFAAETDRVYINSTAACVIEDAGFKRSIRIAKSGSLSTVVWNPWTDKANRMGDLGRPDGWREFVCVESANAWDNSLTLAPGEEHTLHVEYSVENS